MRSSQGLSKEDPDRLNGTLTCESISNVIKYVLDFSITDHFTVHLIESAERIRL